MIFVPRKDWVGYKTVTLRPGGRTEEGGNNKRTTTCFQFTRCPLAWAPPSRPPEHLELESHPHLDPEHSLSVLLGAVARRCAGSPYLETHTAMPKVVSRSAVSSSTEGVFSNISIAIEAI